MTAERPDLLRCPACDEMCETMPARLQRDGTYIWYMDFGVCQCGTALTMGESEFADDNGVPYAALECEPEEDDEEETP